MNHLAHMSQFISQRVSQGILTEPGPSPSELDLVIEAALRAPDHMRLKPSRFILIEGSKRAALGDVFVEAKTVREGPLSDEVAKKVRAMPLRAPTILVGVCTVVEHPKVPEHEQLMSSAVGLGYALLALRDIGLNGIWRTGEFAEDVFVKSALNLASHEHIVGFLYVGTPASTDKVITAPVVEEVLTRW